MSQHAVPARGEFPELTLEKKAPKNTQALLIAAFEGEDGIELPGT